MGTPGTLFVIGGVRLTAYGLLIAAGLLAGYVLASHRARSVHIRDSAFQKAYFAMLLAGALTARIVYAAIEFRSVYAGSLGLTLRFWEGGYSVYGAIAGCVIGIRLSTGKSGFGRALDTFMPAIALTLAIWRVGELTTWQGRGTMLDVSTWFFPYSIPNSQGTVCLAVCMYEAAAALIVMLLGLPKRQGKPAGYTGYTCLMLLSLAQVTLESMRTDDFLEINFVKIDQLLAMIIAAYVLIVFMRGTLRAGRGYAKALVPIGISAAMIGLCVAEEFKIDGSPNPAFNFMMLGIYTAVMALCGLYLRAGWSAACQAADAQKQDSFVRSRRTAPDYRNANHKAMYGIRNTPRYTDPRTPTDADAPYRRTYSTSNAPGRNSEGAPAYYSRSVDAYRSAQDKSKKSARRR